MRPPPRRLSSLQNGGTSSSLEPRQTTLATLYRQTHANHTPQDMLPPGVNHHNHPQTRYYYTGRSLYQPAVAIPSRPPPAPTHPRKRGQGRTAICHDPTMSDSATVRIRKRPTKETSNTRTLPLSITPLTTINNASKARYH